MSGDLKNRIDAIDSNAKGLITAAENKTGDQFENLPAAVNELIEGYGQGGDYSWLDVENLNPVVPEGVRTIPAYCFDDRTLQSLTVNCKPVRVNTFGFYNIQVQATIDLTECKAVGAEAFNSSRNFTFIMGDKFENLSKNAFRKCVLPKLHLPVVAGIGAVCFDSTAIQSNGIYIGAHCANIGASAFAISGGGQGKTIYIAQPEDSISGAPWGATNATIVWDWDGETYYDD